MPEKKQRLLYVDMAKSIALILVVYSHIPGALWQPYLGSFFIFAFFFLSGFTGGTRASWKEHVLKRARRLLIPYVLFSACLVVLSSNLTLLDLEGVAYSRFCLYPLDVRPNIIFLRHCNSPLWFLTAMFVSDIVYYTLIKRIKSKKGLAISFVLLLLSVCAMDQLPVLLPWSIDTMPFFVIAMLAGHEIRQHEHVLSQGKFSVLILIILFVAACYLNGNINLSCRIYGHYIRYALVSGITGTLLMLIVCKALEGYDCSRILGDAGRHTLTIFSLQMAVIHVCVNTLQTMGLTADSGLWHAVVSLAIIVVVFVVGTALSVVLRRLLPSVF